MTSNHNERSKITAKLFGFAFAWFFIYAFFHEAGHAIVGMAYGGTVERFVFWNFNAHVSVVGAEFTAFGRALFHAAGNLFPIILTTLVFVFYKPTYQSKVYHICHLIPIISIVFGNLLGWVVIPIRMMFSQIMGEDAARFLNATGFHPLLVALTAILLLVAFVSFAYAKGILKGAIMHLHSLHKDIDVKPTRFNTKWGVVSLILVLSAVGGFSIATVVPYTPSGVAHIQLEIPDVREEIQRGSSFTVTENRSYTIILNVDGQGFLTGFRISDEEGTQVLGTYGETMFSVMGITLTPGVYTATFYFMTNWEAVRRFYYDGEATEHLVAEHTHSSHEVFAGAVDDYSVTVSMVIR